MREKHAIESSPKFVWYPGLLTGAISRKTPCFSMIKKIAEVASDIGYQVFSTLHPPKKHDMDFMTYVIWTMSWSPVLLIGRLGPFGAVFFENCWRDSGQTGDPRKAVAFWGGSRNNMQGYWHRIKRGEA
ncbi:MAG: hypothetical protein M0Z52_06920 [Actinomycetota bacterium]|nr:hypothetical protein [Actinomycetota bacterium]